MLHKSETCVILHKMIITAVDNEEIDSVDGVDISTEFYEPDNQSGDSYGTDVERLNGSVQHDHEAFLEEFFIQEFHLTHRCGFETMQMDLIEVISSTGGRGCETD